MATQRIGEDLQGQSPGGFGVIAVDKKMLYGFFVSVTQNTSRWTNNTLLFEVLRVEDSAMDKKLDKYINLWQPV
jgi:hypothetical protein